MASYFETIINRVVEQLKLLVLKNPNDPTQPRPITPVNPMPAPNSGYNTPIWLLGQRPVRTEDYVNNNTIPLMFVSFVGGRLQSGTGDNNLLQNKIESIDVRVEVVLNESFGPEDTANPGSPKKLTHQSSGVMEDLNKLLNFGTMRHMMFDEPSSQVVDANIVEWGFDQTKRGTMDEILIVIFEVIVSVPRNLD